MVDLDKEAILEAWLAMVIAIDAQRVTTELPFNEAVVCNFLKNHQDEEVTATKLCQKMKMQKSLMNRTLDNLENKGLIKRQNSAKDKRKKIVTLVWDENNLYFRQHQDILAYVDRIIDHLEDICLSDLRKIFESITAATNSFK